MAVVIEKDTSRRQVMNMSKAFRIAGRMSLGVLLTAAAIGFGGQSASADSKAREGVQAVPTGYDHYMTYIANGLFDPKKPSTDPHVTNCDPVINLCDGYYYQHNIIGRSDAEIAARELQAKAYFKNISGIDVDAPENAGRIMFKMFQIDPRINLHVVSAAGESVPSEGWQIHDGGWIVMVMDPNGYDLVGGQFPGFHAALGTYFVFAEYAIDPNVKTGPHWHKHRRPLIVLEVTSMMPMNAADPGFMCGLTNPDFGDGMVQGFGEAMPSPGGLTKYNIVGVLTFPGLGRVDPAN